MTPSLLEILLVAILATYRLTLLLKVGQAGENSEPGPGGILDKFRAQIGIYYDEYSKPKASNWRAEALLCFLCLSVWLAIGVGGFIFATWLLGRIEVAIFVLFPFAASGGAIYLKKMAG